MAQAEDAYKGALAHSANADTSMAYARLAQVSDSQHNYSQTIANAKTSIGTPTAKIGTLTFDPELRTSAAGKPYLRVRLAVKPFVSGADQETETLFYDVVAFGSLAEHTAKSLHKGDRVVVIGTGKRNTWTGRDGHERTTNEIVANGLGPDLRFASIALEQLPEQATAELGIT